MMKPWLEKSRIEKPKRNLAKKLPGKLAVSNLKLCPLCDSLNARSNQVCFVCGWHGDFVHDSRSIHTSLVLLVEQCPELAEEVIPLARPKILQRMFHRMVTHAERFMDRVKARLIKRTRRGRHLDLWI